MLDISALKDFIDLGGIFILALLLVYQQFKFSQSIDEKLVKILTLLAVLTKTQTNFNGIEKILDKDAEKVVQSLTAAESGS